MAHGSTALRTGVFASALTLLVLLAVSPRGGLAQSSTPESPTVPGTGEVGIGDQPVVVKRGPGAGDVTGPRIVSMTPAPGNWVVSNTGLGGVAVEFSEPVAVPPDGMVAWGALSGAVSITPTPIEGTNRVVFLFSAPVRDDRLIVVLDSSIGDFAGHLLDGEIANPSSAFLPSGDGVAGGQAIFVINILQGDADRSGVVDQADGAVVSASLGRRPGEAGFDARADLNGDGFINVLDVAIWRNGLGRTLPTTDGSAPLIASVSPDPAQGFFGDLAEVTVTFSEAIAPPSGGGGGGGGFFNQRTALLESSVPNSAPITPTSAVLSPDGMSATYFFDPPLPQCARYTLKLSNALSDASTELFAPPPPDSAPVLSGLQPVPAAVLDAHETLIGSVEFVLSGAFPGGAGVGATVEVSGPGGVVTGVVNADGRFVVAPILSVNRMNQLFVTGISACGVRGLPVTTMVTVDTQPPSLFIDFPGVGSETTNPTTDVAGRVGDTLSGFMGLTVTVNGQSAEVDIGIGTNGTFFLPDLVLNESGPTTITAVARDRLGNQTVNAVQVTRVVIPPDAIRMDLVSGNGQLGTVNTALTDPVVVRMTRPDGTGFAGKLVTFEVTRSDGRLKSDPSSEEPGALLLQVFTDAQGYARAYWTLGSDAGCGNNRLTAVSRDIAGTIQVCASAHPAPADQINIGLGNNQKGEAGAPLGMPLSAWVSDGCNPAPGIPVTFTVIRGGGLVNGFPSVTVNTAATGHAMVNLTLGPDEGTNEVEANFAGNPGNPATFIATGLARDPTKLTSFSGLVLDNAMQPIGGARCWIIVNGVQLGETYTTEQGQFNFPDLGSAGGDTDLWVDGLVATQLGGPLDKGGMMIPVGSFPGLHYEIAIVPNAENSLPMPVLLPRLNPNNARPYSTTQDTILTVEGIEGLKMTIKAGSMRMAGTGLPAPDGTVVALNQVHHDDIPMPMPDGAAPPFAWTLQPAGAHFDPPIAIEYPNMSALPPGAIANFLSFDHDTSRFEIVSSGHVIADGSLIVSDPGSGLPFSGWGGNCPPYSVTGTVASPECSGRQDDEANECERFAISAYIASHHYLAQMFGENGLPARALQLWFEGSGADDVHLGDTVWAELIQTSTAYHRSQAFIESEILRRAAAGDIGAFPVDLLESAGRPALMPDFYDVPLLRNSIGGINERAQAFVDSIEPLGNGTFRARINYTIQDIYRWDGVGQEPWPMREAGPILQQSGQARPFRTHVGFTRHVIIAPGPLPLTYPPNLEHGRGAAGSDTDVWLFDWNFSVAGQSAAVDRAFRSSITNISSADLFGQGGPGTAPDFLSDNFLRVSGTAEIGGVTYYASSASFQIRQGETYIVPSIQIGDRPPPLPQSIQITAPQQAIEVGQTTQLTVTGTLLDGSEVDVTPRAAFTTYRTSNPIVASVDPDGLLTARSAGFAVITATNDGATASAFIRVRQVTDQTTLSGVVLSMSGVPISGAEVSVVEGGATTLTDSDGRFVLITSVPASTDDITVRAFAQLGGVLHEGQAVISDILLGGFTDAGVIILGPSAPTIAFADPVYVPVGDFPWRIELSDVNSDGSLDIVAITSPIDGSFRILLNDGVGFFDPLTEYFCGCLLFGLAVADVNGDNAPDVVTAGLADGRLNVFINDGSGVFEETSGPVAAIGATDLAFADLDADSDCDLISVNSADDSITRFLNNGSGSFIARVRTVTGDAPRAVKLADIDGGNTIDAVVVRAESPTGLVFVNSGTGVFPTRLEFDAGQDPADCEIGDWNSDGALDLAIAGAGGISVASQSKGTTLFDIVYTPLDYDPTRIRAGDLDNDGDLDLLAVGGTTDVLTLLSNNGFGQFVIAANIDLAESLLSIGTGDIDRDGDLDVLIGLPDTDRLAVLRNTRVQRHVIDRTRDQSTQASLRPRPIGISTVANNGETDHRRNRVAGGTRQSNIPQQLAEGVEREMDSRQASDTAVSLHMPLNSQATLATGDLVPSGAQYAWMYMPGRAAVHDLGGIQTLRHSMLKVPQIALSEIAAARLKQLVTADGSWNLLDAFSTDDPLVAIGHAQRLGDAAAVLVLIEFRPYAEPCCDLDADGRVGLSDLQRVLAVFGSESDIDCDLNLDGVVNLTDLRTIIDGWTGAATIESATSATP